MPVSRLGAWKMKANKPLFKSIQFWVFTLSPIAIALGIIWSTSHFSEMKMQWNAEGLKTFYEYFKLPIAIFSLSIPLGALAASQHRSLQTAEQINQQARQNEFSNRISHKESFTQFFKDVAPFGSEKTNTAWEIYECLFPVEDVENLLPTPKVKEVIEEGLRFQSRILNRFHEAFASLNTPPDLIQAFIDLSSFRKGLYELIGHQLTVNKIEEGRQPVTNLSELVVKLCLGLIDCANFQRPSISSAYRSNLNSRLDEIALLEDRHEAMSDLAGLVTIYLNSEADSLNKKKAKVEKIVDAYRRVNSPECLGTFEDVLDDLKEHHLEEPLARELEALKPELFERMRAIKSALDSD